MTFVMLVKISIAKASAIPEAGKRSNMHAWRKKHYKKIDLLYQTKRRKTGLPWEADTKAPKYRIVLDHVHRRLSDLLSRLQVLLSEAIERMTN